MQTSQSRNLSVIGEQRSADILSAGRMPALRAFVSIQTQADDQSNRDADADEHALHHRAHGLVAFGQFLRGVELGEVIDDFVADEYEADGDEAADNGVEKIGENDGELHASSSGMG